MVAATIRPSDLLIEVSGSSSVGPPRLRIPERHYETNVSHQTRVRPSVSGWVGESMHRVTELVGIPWPPGREREAYLQQLPELRSEHEGKYVALFRGRVIGVGDTTVEAAQQARASLAQPKALFIHKVGEPLAESKPLSLRPDAPRRIVNSA